MVEECVHLFPDGRKCRRIPKRGQKLCPAHHPQRRRRTPLEENEAFLKEMFAFVDTLRAMDSADLLYATTGFLADIHALIDRCSSRSHRIAFSRASTAVGIAQRTRLNPPHELLRLVMGCSELWDKESDQWPVIRGQWYMARRPRSR